MPEDTPKAAAKGDILDLLLAAGAVNEDEADQARRRQRRARGSLADALIELGTISQEQIFRAVAETSDLPFVDLHGRQLSDDLFDNKRVPVKVILHYRFVPLELEKNTLTAAFSEPPSARDLQQLRLLIGLRVQPVIATRTGIDRAIKEHCGLGAETLIAIRNDADFQKRVEQVTVDAPSESLDAANEEDASVSHLLKQFLLEALQMKATDIHLEPFEDHVQLRYRIDGLLREVPTPAGLRQLHAALISRAKVLANLNIAEHRLPHDGRIRVDIGDEEFDLRVSILPTRFGETLNLRILNRASIFLSLEGLGLEKEYLGLLERLLDLPHGMILVTGPTGSGKSTTLYAALDKTDKLQRKVITVENPVEYQMDGISQIQINAGIGLTFASCLRSILRHDPDIILVGEIRDGETAEIGIRSALTGHLVLSTLHTNDSVGAVNRLIDMGVEPFLVASSLTAVIAQRLVRRICKHCKQEVDPDEISPRIRIEMADTLQCNEADVKIWQGVGCEECNHTGYAGRVAIHEFFLMNEHLQDMVSRHATTVEVRDRAIQDGMRVLRQDGWLKVARGVTTVEEILRITTAYDIHY